MCCDGKYGRAEFHLRPDQEELGAGGTAPSHASYTAEAAAWTSVANVLLNLDGVLTNG